MGSEPGAAGRLCGICIRPWFLPTFVRATCLADLHYVALLPPLDVCIERVRSRVGHGSTDPSVTRDMHQQFAAAAIDARHVIKESASQPAELAEMIRGES
jgi:hypothetical protein